MGDDVTTVQGWVAAGFEGVRDAFQANLDEGAEVGAAFAAYHRGRKVVDLWGGVADRRTGLPWEEDTVVLVYSTTKGVTAMCANRLAQEGLLEVEAPVARYWPEFAQAGKESLPVRYVLDHRAGLPIIQDPLWPGAIYDPEAICRALAAQAPLWEPGTVAAYHIHTQGFLMGEIIRRVTGRTVGTFLREEIAAPLGADYMIGGLTPRDEARCAEVQPNMQARLFAAREAESES
ncbi:MAG TPA: serine hydrolase domain-containing protein, partial [Acidimicrobiales bacterium]|nr:serine hydrolase domain-containing protein [Acidimicrobiales bacterium]